MRMLHRLFHWWIMLGAAFCAWKVTTIIWPVDAFLAGLNAGVWFAIGQSCFLDYLRFEARNSQEAAQ